MKGQADMKKKTTEQVEEVGEIIEERDRAITLYSEWLYLGIEATTKLIERIRAEGVSHLTVADFDEPLENLGRFCFVSWIEDIADRCWATPKRIIEYNNLYTRYVGKISRLARTVKECAPDTAHAQQLAAAIDRLNLEVAQAIDRGVEYYNDGKGKPQPNDLLSDTRHGALWDNVENAIAALSSAQAATPNTEQMVKGLLRRALKGERDKQDAVAMKQEQRERAAQWLKNTNADKPKDEWFSIVDAARHFGNEIEDEKGKGGYADADSLQTALNKKAKELGIAQYKTSKAGRPRKA